MTRYFIDTEFLEGGRGGPIGLLSLAIVAESGREFYAENAYAQTTSATPWIRNNVLPHLQGGEAAIPPTQIVTALLAFIGNDPAPEFWGYYCAYDWVVLCQLFGDMSALPKGWPYLAYDLRQALDLSGRRAVKQDDDAVHHALSDARWIRETWATYWRSHRDA